MQTWYYLICSLIPCLPHLPCHLLADSLQVSKREGAQAPAWCTTVGLANDCLHDAWHLKWVIVLVTVGFWGWLRGNTSACRCSFVPHDFPLLDFSFCQVLVVDGPWLLQHMQGPNQAGEGAKNDCLGQAQGEREREVERLEDWMEKKWSQGEVRRSRKAGLTLTLALFSASLLRAGVFRAGLFRAGYSTLGHVKKRVRSTTGWICPRKSWSVSPVTDLSKPRPNWWPHLDQGEAETPCILFLSDLWSDGEHQSTWDTGWAFF